MSGQGRGKDNITQASSRIPDSGHCRATDFEDISGLVLLNCAIGIIINSSGHLIPNHTHTKYS